MSNDIISSSEEVFKSVIENGADLVIITDANGIVTYISPQCHDVIGYKGKDILGIMMPDFIHPDDKERCGAEWKKVRDGGATHGFEYRIIDNQGDIRRLSHSAKYVKDNDNIIGIQNIIRNITERKYNENALLKSERMLSAIISKSPIPKVQLDFNEKLKVFGKGRVLSKAYR